MMSRYVIKVEVDISKKWDETHKKNQMSQALRFYHKIHYLADFI